MRNILAFLAALALTVVGAGYYLGWYSVKSTLGAGGHRSVNIDINTNKLEQDVEKGAAKLEQAIQKQGAQPQKPGEPVNAILPTNHQGPSFDFGHPVNTTEPQQPVLPTMPPSLITPSSPVPPTEPVLPPTGGPAILPPTTTSNPVLPELPVLPTKP